MHFHANYVSTSVFGDGDYYQAMFEAEQESDDPDSPYLLIQGNSKIQMTICATSKCMTKNTAVISITSRVYFTSKKLSIEIERPRDNFVSVTFAMVATEFAEASQVLKIISGEIEPP